MPIRVTDHLLYPSRGTADKVVDYLQRKGAKRPDEAEACVRETYRLCKLVGIDAAIAVARMADETGDRNGPAIFVSDVWNDRLNPAGMGVTDGGDERISFPNGKAAARAYIAHLMTYIYGSDFDMGGLTPKDDPRYAATPPHWRGSVSTLLGLEGKWFTLQGGAQNSANRGNAIFPELPDQKSGNVATSELNMAPGLIPLPQHVEDIIDVSRRNMSDDCRGYDSLGHRPETPRFLVLHKSQCDADASNSGYFHQTCCPALTDWEVVAATGQMRRFVRRGNAPSGWANGKVSKPYGDALKWLNQNNWDLNTVNRDGESIEITGWFPVPWEGVTIDTPVSEAAWANLAQWMASRAHDYGIRWDDFPLIPSEGNRSYVTWHQEWTIGTGKTCPGPIVMNYTTTLIDRARSIMKEAQTHGMVAMGTGTATTTYPDADIPGFLVDDLAFGEPRDHVVNGKAFHAIRREYVATRTTRRLRHATTARDAEVIGPPFRAGERIEGWYWFRSNNRTWILTPFGARVYAPALSPRVTFEP